ncbi:hypothetical protein V5T82_14175 [Magnetovibrio sp. PR-2]|uniref:hypothetical protein n=1 Tax=Magnetovibrio sp. PR-2 TaxID=3120356 RepID=UPI002FCE3DBF
MTTRKKTTKTQTQTQTQTQKEHPFDEVINKKELLENAVDAYEKSLVARNKAEDEYIECGEHLKKVRNDIWQTVHTTLNNQGIKL